MIRAYKRFFTFSNKYKKEWLCGIILEILRSIFEALQFPAFLVVIQAILKQNRSYIWAVAAFGIMLVSVIGSIVCWSIAHTKEGIASYRTCEGKRIDIGNRLKYMPMGFFDGSSLGNITAVATTTMEDMQAMSFAVIVRTLTGVIYSIVMSFAMTFFEWRIGLLFLLGTVVFILINGILLKKSDIVSPRRLASQTKLVDAVLEYIQGMSVVKSFHLSEKADSRLIKTIDETQKENLNVEQLRIPYIAVETAVLHLVCVAVVFLSVVLFLQKNMALIICLLMAVFAFMMYNRLLTAGKMFFMLPMIMASIDRVETVMNSPTMDISGRNIRPEHHTIEVNNVHFGYDDTEIIKGVSFTVPENTVTAIVGPSGSGKTTLISLIARFWDTNSGTILLGGHNVKDYSLDSLLENFSIVFQNVYLFADTVENNIRFGKSDATHEEVVEAARKACCHDFISALPNGYNTLLGEGGATVSGGEKQRISIARAILKDSHVIILDEATANVDPENEKQLSDAIKELTHKKTVIMIAHRLKTVRDAEQIIVLNQGKIVSKGKHDELLNKSKIYRDFVLGRQFVSEWKINS